VEQLVVRRGDRRQSRRFYGGFDRRSGFDRRASRSVANRLLVAVRDEPAILLTLLISLNVMNVLDFLFTIGALEAGYAEGNPFMALMFARGYVVAGGIKFVIIATVSIAIWRMRRYRSVLQVAVFACVVFACILLVHGYGKLLFY
jgi:hypothetical protein